MQKSGVTPLFFYFITPTFLQLARTAHLISLSITSMAPVIAIIFFLFNSQSIAAEPLAEQKSPDLQTNNSAKIGLEVGVFSLTGNDDYHITYQNHDSSWLYGLRYFNTEIEIGQCEFFCFSWGPAISKYEYSKRAGIYFEYILDNTSEFSQNIFSNKIPNRNFYLRSALFKTTNKIICGTASDRDSATTIYLGAGGKEHYGDSFEFTYGFLVAPFYAPKLSTPVCNAEYANGNPDLDYNVGFTFKF